MTVKATVQEIRDAYRALRRINEEVRLPAKGAWRAARLANKLKAEVVAFEQTQLKLFREAGGVEMNGGVNLVPPVRGEHEPQDAFGARGAHFQGQVNELNARLRELNAEALEVDYDALPLALLGDALISPNDLADLGPFISEDHPPKAEG